jgi:predicted TIM-barrel fold metal-dependent hydrolase
LTAIAKENPTLPIIVAHGGLGKPTLTTASVVIGTQNVFAELPSSLVDIREARRLVAAIPPQRLLFGSDVPLLEPAFVIGTYEDLQLDPETLKRVYWDNAVALFGYEG